MKHLKNSSESRTGIKVYLYFFVLIFPAHAFGQIPSNTWRTHYNYTDARGLAVVKDQVYCFTVNGFFAFDKVEKHFDLLDKENGLSGGTISDIFYDVASGKIVVAYSDGGIDLVLTDSKGKPLSVLYIEDFRTSEVILGDKSIKRIVSGNKNIYLSTGNAILVLDAEQGYLKEVIQNVGRDGSVIDIDDIRSTPDSLYIKTLSGSIVASSLASGNNILFYGNWHPSANRKLFDSNLSLPPQVSKNYINEVIIDDKGSYWIADGVSGLISDYSGAFTVYNPPGLPEYNGNLKGRDEVLFYGKGTYKFENNRWVNYSGPTPLNSATDAFGNEWAISGRGLMVVKGLNSYTYNGSNGLPGGVLSFVIDKNQQVWIGTDNGVSVVQSGPNAVSTPRQAFNPVFGNQRLLIREAVPAITVDQGNRKWIGTEKGIYLFNESGEEKIIYFDEANSPLPDGKISNVIVEPKTGEVFIQTGSGIVSYQSDASAPGEDLSAISVYPNPVKDNFPGVLTIGNLMEDTEVKITDVAGNPVYNTVSNGGKAVWDLVINGRRAPHGIYLIVCRSSSGSKTARFVIRP